MLKKEKVELRNTVDGSLCILGDATRWQQLLGNLISNAIKHTTTGSVTVTMHALSRKQGTRGKGRSKNDSDSSDAGSGSGSGPSSKTFSGTHSSDSLARALCLPYK